MLPTTTHNISSFVAALKLLNLEKNKKGHTQKSMSQSQSQFFSDESQEMSIQ